MLDLVIKHLMQGFGPLGFLSAILLLGYPVLWRALNKSRETHVADLKESQKGLLAAADATRESNHSREALVATVKEIATTQQHQLLRIERLIALAEHDRSRHD